MTRKDYVALAVIVKRHTIVDVSSRCAETHLAVVYCMARDMADIMSEDNPRFDRARFLKACGVQS